MYPILKNTHILLVAVSVCLFIIRFIWRLFDSKILNKGWTKIVPHCVDTLLLLSGLALIYVTGFIPFTPAGPWLTEKLFCVLAYIGLGYVALRPKTGTLFRVFSFCGALGWIYLAASLAVNKIPYY